MKEVFFVSKVIYLPVSRCLFQNILLLSIPSYAISFFLIGFFFLSLTTNTSVLLLCTEISFFSSMDLYFIPLSQHIN